MIHPCEGGEKMRGTDEMTGALFSFVDSEDRIPARPPLQKIRQIDNDALASLQGYRIWPMTDFAKSSDHPAPFRFWETGSEDGSAKVCHGSGGIALLRAE